MENQDQQFAESQDETLHATHAIASDVIETDVKDDATGHIEEVRLQPEEVVTSAEEPPIPEAIQEEEVSHECSDVNVGSVSMTYLRRPSTTYMLSCLILLLHEVNCSCIQLREIACFAQSSFI